VEAVDTKSKFSPFPVSFLKITLMLIDRFVFFPRKYQASLNSFFIEIFAKVFLGIVFLFFCRAARSLLSIYWILFKTPQSSSCSSGYLRKSSTVLGELANFENRKMIGFKLFIQRIEVILFSLHPLNI